MSLGLNSISEAERHRAAADDDVEKEIGRFPSFSENGEFAGMTEELEVAEPRDAVVEDLTTQTGTESNAEKRLKSLGWKHFSRCSICLGALVGLFFLLAIGLLIAWAVTSNGFRNLGGGITDICSTKACITAASRLSSSIDDSDRPCENFYRHACGKFLFQHSSSGRKRDFRVEMQERIDSELNSLLSQPSNPRFDQSIQFLHAIYQSCMALDTRRNLGIAPFLNLLRDLPCGPIFTDCASFNADFYSWERHAGMMDFYVGAANLLVLDKDVLPANKQQIVLAVKPVDLSAFMAPIKAEVARLLSGGSQLEADPLMVVYMKQRVLNEIAQKLLGRTPADVQVIIEEVAEFIILLDKISSDPAKPVSVIPMSELLGASQQINVQNFLDASFTAIHQWTLTDTVIVYDITYIGRLADLLAKTPKRTIANYLTVMAAWNLRNFLLVGEDPDRTWKNCVEEVGLLDPVIKLYAEAQNPPNFREIWKFLNDLKISYDQHHASSVVNTVSIKVGLPQRLFNEKEVFAPFEKVHVDSNDYFGNIVGALKAQRTYELSRIGSQLENDESINNPQLTPSLVYNLNEDSIAVPLAVLQPPLIVPGTGATVYSTLATFGFVFLQMLAKIKATAEMKSEDYRLKSQCVADVFNELLNRDSLFSGRDISNDVIHSIEMADALNAAISKYLDWQKETRVFEEQRLPGFENTTSLQQVFLGFATLHCSTSANSDDPSEELLINSIVKNSPQFTKSFSCFPAQPLYNHEGRSCV